MNYLNSVLLFKNKERLLKSEELSYIDKFGVIYEGQAKTPLQLYSIVVNQDIDIVVFDPKEFDNLEEVVDVLASLQDFTGCYIILYSNIPDKYKDCIKVIEPRFGFSNSIISVSDCFLQIKKMQQEVQDNKRKAVYNKIQNILLHLGFVTSQKGFDFICDAVYFVYVKNKINQKLISNVYDLVAKQNMTYVYIVERAIRNAINTAMNNCDHKKLSEHNTLKCFNDLMFHTTAKNLIFSIVNFLKYNTIFE